MRHLKWMWIPLLSLLFLVGQAAAQAPDATQAFEQGRERFEAQDYQAALPLFRQALSASGSPNARIYVARCLRELGQLVDASEEMSRTVRDARKLAAKEERYAQTRDAAAAELAVLEGKVGKVVVALDPDLAGATVELNGKPLAPEQVGVPAAVLPGSVNASAVLGDGTRVEQSILVVAGEVATVTLSARAVPSESDGGFGVVRGLGIGVTLLGAGGLAAFAVGTIIANDKLATLDSSCGAGPCTDPAMSTVIDEGQTAEIVAFVGLGLGIAGTLGGVAMIIWGGDDGEEAMVSAGPGSATLKLRF